MKTMSPFKPMTDGQIGKFNELIAARLRKLGLPSDAVQYVLETQGDEIAEEQVLAFRKRVEAVNSMIVRRASGIDRSLSPDQHIDATGRVKYINAKVLETMPRGEGDEVDVYFFDLGYDPTPEELEREYAVRGLKSDPVAQAKVNKDDPAFADERPNACQWDVKDGQSSCAVFRRSWSDERSVFVCRNGILWSRRFRFGGVRK